MSLLSRLAVEAARGFGVLSSKKSGVSASYLVVAGGGGGGRQQGGGGGAGGYQASSFTLSTLNTYTVVVGAGGIAGSSGAIPDGGSGGNSSISGTGLSTVTSIGGGGGDGNGGSSAGSGGSGGGGGVGSATGGSGTSGQGNNGGSSTGSGAGGGGASAVGSNSGARNGGNGGAGSASSITGSSVTYAGGGGGGGYADSGTPTAGSGGTGGGGAGGITSTAGTANTGGGGGGGSQVAGIVYNGAAGGSGIVVVSYASATPLFTGGTITTSGGNQIHTFTSTGALTPLTPITASYLVVAGGAGGASAGGGGGGAGGLLTNTTTLYANATYIVTVGAGGAGVATGTQANGNQGSNSSVLGTGLTTITSIGGGYGGTFNGAGNTGGSGGGGGGRASAAGGAGTSGQGFAGGAALSGNTSSTGRGGGGGGASAVGASGDVSGNGGAGSASSISGTSVTYAGGGGGGNYNQASAGTGGAGGGGAGGFGSASSSATAGSGVPGTANLGAGGGAGGGTANANTSLAWGGGGAGGSGTVIISYAGTQQFNGGIITSIGGNTIHTFNATGALTPLSLSVGNSLRFQSASSQYMARTPSVAGNRQKFTFSFWAKRGTLSAAQEMYFVNSGGGNFSQISWTAGNGITITSVESSVANCELITTPVYRDPSAWYHLVFSVDTTQATAANRVKIYVNGNQVTALSTATYPSLNYNFQLNNTTAQNIGRPSTGTFDGYLAEFNFVDGQALEPYYFGNNDANGLWSPIKYTGTYGTNGFYLNFNNGTSTTTLGTDASGNGNNWTLTNFTRSAGVSDCWMYDVPAGGSGASGTQPSSNYATWNPLYSGLATYASANLQATTSTVNAQPTTIFASSGKWYAEFVSTSGTAANTRFGVCNISGVGADLGGSANGWAYLGDARVYNNGSAPSYGVTYATNDVLQIALDLDVGRVWYGKNGTWMASGSPSTNANPSQTFTANQLMSFAIASGTGSIVYVANMGQRSFAYTPPTGFKALCTANLPVATIKRGNQYMDATLWTGGQTSPFSVTNAGGFKPDLVWAKQRSAAASNRLYDSVRGTGIVLYSNQTAAEGTETNTGVSAFQTNGFQITNTNGVAPYLNDTSATYVGWQWQAGQGVTSSNTAGTITSTTSVSTTAGFSVVTYTSTTATSATIGHGLGVAPSMMIIKVRNGVSNNWAVYHKSLGNANWIFLNSTSASGSASGAWNTTDPTSSVFSVAVGGGTGNNWTNTAGYNYVAYCFAEIAGFSKFGSYTGNGSADGPFTFTGFTPRWILIKQSSTSGNNWQLLDTARETYNPNDTVLFPNTSGAESTLNATLDFVSNGFKLRTTDGTVNTNGATYIYMAFASNPFANSNAR